MRSRSLLPASQLHSVALRYRWGCARPHDPGRGWSGVMAWGVEEERSSHVAGEAPTEGAAALARLEAVLMLAREPLGSRKLSQYANLADATEARTLIRQLNERYDRRGRAFRVVEVAGGYQLLTRPQLAAWLRRLEHTPGEVRLSAPALETLAVIAYRQPVGRADIEAIRGVNCGEIIRQLMDRDLVKIGGRSEELGRPYLYATTRRFLQIFGLSSLEDLPRADIVRQAVVPPPPAPEAASETRVFSSADNIDSTEEESDVSVTTLTALDLAEEERKLRRAQGAASGAPELARDDDEDDFDDEDEDEEFDDDEDDLDDIDDDDEFEDEEDEEFEDEDDLEDEEWEEVDEEDEELDEDDDLDDDDDDWDDDEEDEDWEDEE